MVRQASPSRVSGYHAGMDATTIETPTHGRFLVEGTAPRLFLTFHGYGQNAEIAMRDAMRIPGIERWTVVAVQGLHRFYERKTGEVVASWMTSQDRELAIADNIEYVRRMVARFPAASAMVFAGFSQGAAMAYRAAAAIPSAGVVALGGDVPPDVTGPLPSVLIGRGERDDWYTAEKLKKDLSFLEGRAQVQAFVFDGGHEWSDVFSGAVGEFLRSVD